MMLMRLVPISLVLIAACAGRAFAQSSTTIDGLTLSDALVQLTRPGGSAASGEAIGFNTALEVATAPLGASTAGFVFKLDPATGLQIRTATTFGPSFGERALTAGAGKVSVAANLIVATHDRIGSFDLNALPLSALQSSDPQIARSSQASLALSSQTMVLYGAIGATDSLDFTVAVPMVKVSLEGLSWVERGDGNVLLRAETSGIASGLGDIAFQAKYRLLRFGEGEPDPGGVAVMGTLRLPTGDRDNLRGLGVTRTMASVVVSSGRGRLRPHGSVGFELWSDGLDVAADPLGRTSVTAKNQLQYAGGIEFEAAPKVTLLVDMLGRHILGGGRLETQSFSVNLPEATSFDALVGTTGTLRKIAMAPGLKWNVKGTALLSLSALIPLTDNGLHDRFTPVIGLDWTF